MVDVSEVIPVDHRSSEGQAPRHKRVLDAAWQHRGAWRILFVHGDGGGDVEAARDGFVQPALDAVKGSFTECGAVGVVPVRESEAWAISDGDALRQVLCTELTNEQFGIPDAPRGVEGVLDPKLALRSAFLATNPPPQRRRQGVGSLLAPLGDAVNLELLRHVPSFARMEMELAETLESIGVFR